MIDRAFELLGYRFKDKKLLSVALTHASSADHRLGSNERLEFLGDAILGYVVCEYLFRTYPDLLEGELTKIKSAVVSRKVCAEISRQMNLASMLSLGKGVGSRSVLPGSIAAAVLEAVIAAIYLDSGIEPARRFILDRFMPYIDEAASSAHQQNFKSILQQYAQQHLPSIPAYLLLDEKGPDHSKCFEVCVEVGGRRYGSAWAGSKKEAEQKAALLALREMNLAEVESDGRVVLKIPVPTRRSSRGKPPRSAGEGQEGGGAEGDEA